MNGGVLKCLMKWAIPLSDLSILILASQFTLDDSVPLLIELSLSLTL